MTHILGIGNALVDSLVQVNNDLILKELSLPKGSMQLIDTERYLELQNRMEAYAPKRTTGGSACNTILAIAHMGGQPGLIGKIGHDEPGRFFAKAFREQGVKTQMLYDKELPTGVASTFITPMANAPSAPTSVLPPICSPTTSSRATYVATTSYI